MSSKDTSFNEEKLFNELLNIKLPKESKFDNSYLPKYIRARREKKVTVKLPNGIKWNTTTKKMFFNLKTLENIIVWRAVNKKPIYIMVEGESGEGKTSVIIWLLGLMLWKLAKIELTKENFSKYFRLSRYISLDPRFITAEFKPKETICIDEIHFVFPHASSMQNRMVLDFADTIREYPAYLIGATPSSSRIDREFMMFRNTIQIIVDYNDLKNKTVKFDVLVNAIGTTAKGERYWQYVTLEEDRVINWCDSELWKLARKMKVGKAYGKDTDAFRTFKQETKDKTLELKEALLDKEITKIFEKESSQNKKIESLLLLQAEFGRMVSYTKIEQLINLRYTKTKTNYKRIKELETKIKYK